MARFTGVLMITWRGCGSCSICLIASMAVMVSGCLTVWSKCVPSGVILYNVLTIIES